MLNSYQLKTFSKSWCPSGPTQISLNFTKVWPKGDNVVENFQVLDLKFSGDKKYIR